MATGKSGLHGRGKGERVIALVKSSSTHWSDSRRTPRFPAPLHLGPFSPPDRDRKETPSAAGRQRSRPNRMQVTLARRRGEPPTLGTHGQQQRAERKRGGSCCQRCSRTLTSAAASTGSLASQRPPGKFPKVPGIRRGKRGFPAAPRERPRESFFNAPRNAFSCRATEEPSQQDAGDPGQEAGRATHSRNPRPAAKSGKEARRVGSSGLDEEGRPASRTAVKVFQRLSVPA